VFPLAAPTQEELLKKIDGLSKDREELEKQLASYKAVALDRLKVNRESMINGCGEFTTKVSASIKPLDEEAAKKIEESMDLVKKSAEWVTGLAGEQSEYAETCLQHANGFVDGVKCAVVECAELALAYATENAELKKKLQETKQHMTGLSTDNTSATKPAYKNGLLSDAVFAAASERRAGITTPALPNLSNPLPPVKTEPMKTKLPSLGKMSMSELLASHKKMYDEKK